MTKKGKRARITRQGENLIAKRALEYPKDGVRRKQRTILAEELSEEFKKLGWDIPELEVLERKISYYRNHETDPKDKAWSMGTLTASEYSIPPDALPIVLHIQEYRRLEEKEPLTIRQALWISRIYKVIPKLRVLSISEVIDKWSNAYATTEIIAGLTQSKLDTSDLDHVILNYPEEYCVYNFSFEYYLLFGEVSKIDEFVGPALNYALKLTQVLNWMKSLSGEERTRYSEYENKLEKVVRVYDDIEKSNRMVYIERIAMDRVLKERYGKEAEGIKQFITTIADILANLSDEMRKKVLNYFSEFSDQEKEDLRKQPKEELQKIINNVVEQYQQKENNNDW